ncbi:MAG TPA: hypothetical protein VFS67_31530 [Polyangiaceae bacterium]|jgi:hypothetical protein|nr:hypothetical protein [Polyangiaceae bacterium]
MNEPEIRFTPLAITRADGSSGCVAAVTPEGGFVRPEPVTVDDVDPRFGIYRYGVWFRAGLVASAQPDARPEDMRLTSAPRAAGELSEFEVWSLLERAAAPSVEQALAAPASIGVVRARIVRVHVTASVGQRFFLRLSFVDQAAEAYDWIVPEVAFGALAWPHVRGTELDAAFAQRFLGLCAGGQVFLTLGLTKPNHRFPGRFGGCHPLVVGVHTRPDYLQVLSQPGGAPLRAEAP